MRRRKQLNNWGTVRVWQDHYVTSKNPIWTYIEFEKFIDFDLIPIGPVDKGILLGVLNEIRAFTW